MKIKDTEKGVIRQNQRLTLITPWDLRSPSHMKAKFKTWTFLSRIYFKWRSCTCTFVYSGPTATKFYTGKLCPEVQPLSYPFTYHFWQKRYPFRIHVPKSVDKCHTFHLLSLELCIPLNCCECTVFKKWINQKTRKFFRFSHSHKMHLLALSSLFTHRNSSTLSSYTSSSEACKRYPFRALSLVEASNVINDPKCNKGPKCNNFWP